MNKIKRKILAVLLTAAMLTAICPVAAWSDEAPAADAAQSEDAGGDNSADDSDAAEEDDSKDKDDEKVDLTPEQGLEAMKKYAENDKFSLYFDEDKTTFAVQSKQDDYVWWSAPLNGDNDSAAKNAQKKNMRSPLYLYYGNIEQHTTTRLSAVDGSINSHDFTLEQIDNGVKVTYNFEKIATTIPVTITLEDDHVNFKVLMDEIKEAQTEETANTILLDIGVNQFFGAGGIDDEGYIVVPDGSGAVINFNNNKASVAYSNDIYGADTSITQLTRPYKTEQVYLPLLGNVIKGDKVNHGYLAILEQGDSYGSVNAATSGAQSATSYNAAWFEFKVRAEDTYYMGERRLQVFESGPIQQPNISINYYPLESEDLSYMDMAERYRQYLIDEKGLTEKKDNIKPFYYLDLYGGTIKAQSIAGFPINMETPATTYAQAVEILEKLKEQGVEHIVVNYDDYNGAGIRGLISASVDYSGTLGGKGEFDKLKSYAEENGIVLSPSVGITFMKDSGNGYSYSLNASRQATKAYATTTNWDIAFGIPHQVRPVIRTTLSPYYWPDLFRKQRESFAAEGVNTICLSDATTLLYTDFSRDVYTRADAIDILTEGYKSLKDSGLTLLADGANAYALPYVDYLTDVPLSSSNFDGFDYDIPFYELVIHGLIPYTTKAINASADASDLIMLALATATPVHYDMMYNDPNEFTDSDYETLFYSNYNGWLEPSADAHKIMTDALSGVMNQKITDYQLPDANTIKTVYEDGTEVTVDLKNYTMTVNGTEYRLADYGLKGEIVSE